MSGPRWLAFVASQDTAWDLYQWSGFRGPQEKARQMPALTDAALGWTKTSGPDRRSQPGWIRLKLQHFHS